MDVRARINLGVLATRMTAEAARPYDKEAATAFLRAAGCRADGEEWVVPLIVLGVLRADEIRIINKRDDVQAS